MTVKTRYAPSPTGYLHLGGLRTALYNYLFARKHGGVFMLRIEDTDRTRYVPGAVESLINTLNRVGLAYDEGPIMEWNTVVHKGANGPYIQSERLKIYKTHANALLENGNAYYCFCSADRLASLRTQQELAKLPTKYDRACPNLSKDEIQAKLSANEPHVIRLKMPDGATTFTDMIRGSITIKNAEVDDQVLLKSDGYPTYHLANVVDDHLMGTTHVIRGEEWLSSVPKHVALYRAFGWDLPAFAHLPLILNPDRSKLSKRQGDVAVEDYLAKGYLPEALINFVALLGFNPKADQELYTLHELTESFEIEKVNKSGAVFMREKLDWMNGEYIRKMSPTQLRDRLLPFVSAAGKTIDEQQLGKICAVERERLVLLADVVDKVDVYLALPEYPGSLLIWKKSSKEDALQQLTNVEKAISALPDETFDSVKLLETSIRRYIEENGLQNGNVLWPLRVALSGASASPSPFELLWVLGREEALRRVATAIERLSS
jgi:glutamyl-tRNA synthetase